MASDLPADPAGAASHESSLHFNPTVQVAVTCGNRLARSDPSMVLVGRSRAPGPACATATQASDQMSRGLQAYLGTLAPPP